jgi:ABC-type glycerol-3-phosphate transport system substrate-binding protein
MKKVFSAAILTAIAMTMTACGTISPPVQTASETTITTTAESLSDSAASSEAERTTDSEQVNTFIAEFFDANICFTDVSTIVTEAMKGCSFETEKVDSNGVQKISLKGKNGGGKIDVLCIDLSQAQIDYGMEYILENFGDYYFGLTSAQMSGITEDDFVSNYRMTSSVVSKGKYQRYGSVQKSDGMATQFGYTETYAVLIENKLTVVSGAYLSTDMMERQSFSQLMGKFAENVKY